MKIQVTVSQPRMENEGRRDQFTTYLVATAKTSVRRRYSDFQWLYGRLQTELPGAIVPIIPHESTLMAKKDKKFDPRFLEKRRRQLQHFLNCVVNHDELQRAPSMTPFMLDKFGTEFDNGRKKVETENPTSTVLLLPEDDDAPQSSSAALKKVSNLFAKMRVRVGKKDAMKQMPQEEQIEAIGNYIQTVENQVKALVRSAEAMTHATYTMATVISDMNAPLAEWKSGYQQSTKVSDDICDMLAALAEFTNDYCHLMHHKHREEQIEFEDLMIRLGNDVKAFKVALRQRTQWQVAYTARCEQITYKEDQIAKATYALKPPEVTGKLSFERSELQRLAHAEKAKLEEITNRFLAEAERSQTRLEQQLKEAFCAYAKIQIAYTQRINDAWGQLLPFVGEEKIQDEAADEKAKAEDDDGHTKPSENKEESIPPPPSNPPPLPPPTTADAVEEEG